MAVEKPWTNAKEREQYICDFVARMVDMSERETQPDRKRWLANSLFFQGEQTFSADRTANVWMSRPMLPEYQAICRRIAAVVQDLIFEDPEFFDFDVDVDRGGTEELARILKNITTYFLKDIDFENNTYPYALVGAIYGIAIAKLTVEAKLEYVPEVIVREIEAQQIADRKKIEGKVEEDVDYDVPDDPELVDGRIKTALTRIFGGTGPAKVREIAPKKRYRLGLRFDHPNPVNWFFDPNVAELNKSPYFIERHFVHFFDIAGKFASGEFDKAKREDVKSSMPFTTGGSGTGGINSSYEEQKINIQGQYDTKDSMPVIELLEYHGDLYDKVGDIVEENVVFFVANRKVLVKDRKNPYYTQKKPYYIARFSPIPFKGVGAGAADNAKELNELINELFGSWLDLMRLAIYQPMAVDTSKLANPGELEKYVVPGALYDTNGAAAGEVFSPIPVNLNAGPGLFQTIESLKLSGDKGAGVDVSSSNPASRARISASEVESNIGRATQSVMALGRELDANYIIPTIERIVDYVLQFAFELDVLADLRDAGVISESEYQLIANIPKIARFNELRRNYKIKVKGFRARLENQEFLKKINEAIAVLSRVPPDVASKIQWPELLKQYFKAFGFDTEKLLAQVTPQDKAREENNLLENDQAIMIGEQDDDAGELPVHYESLMRKPTQAGASHVIAHIQRAAQMGGNVPPPPPQVAQMLGMGQPGQPGQPGEQPQQDSEQGPMQ